jgi:ATP-binding cassette, subfamily B, bacterial PglK
MSQLLRRLWSHLNPRRRMQFGILFLLMILASFAEVLSIGAVLPFLGVLTAPEWGFGHPLAQPFIRALDITEPHQLLLPLTITFSVAALLSGAMRLILLWVQTRLSHAIGADFSISIFRRTLYQPYAVHVARNSSEVIAAIASKTTVVVYQILWPLLIILSSVMILVAILGALVMIEPVVAVTAFAGFGGIYALVIASTRKRLARYSQSISQDQDKVFKALQEGLSGIRDVLIDGTQAAYCEYYRSADLPLRRAQANAQIIGNSPRYGIEALGMVLIAALAYSLAGRPTGIAGAIPVLGALALGAQRLLPVLQQTYSSWAAMRSGQQALSDALDLLDQPLPAYADAPLPEPIPFQQDITLNQLAFRYAPQTPWVLRGLSFTIPKGSRIGFMGSTGSGKSTLLDVIMGLLHPTEGNVSIDGVAITPQNQRAWQAHIAHVPQAIFLADATIAENIAFGVPPDQIDDSRVRQAAQKAQIAQAIESWEHQYNTRVGERGIRLSGGQRQRIGIARALYKQADFIVFDEATSALDNDTERAVMEAIENLGEELTVIIVAHRLSTLKNCTQVIELADGRIKRSGTYQEIIGSAA